MTDSPKPCPFCGHTEITEIQTGTADREGMPVNMVCDYCGAHGPWVYSDPRDAIRQLSDAMAEWNQRTEPK